MSGRGRGRGKGGGRVKRQEVESEDGWTVITHGLSKLNVDGKTPKSKKHHESRIAGVLPSKTVHGLTADRLHSELKNLQERWRDTTVAKQVEELVTKKKWGMKEALCIGIGSFSRDWENRHRSMWQLILFMDVIQNLNKEALIYAQDPAFTPLDIEFLQLLSITTLDTEIEKHITPESFVYSPFVDWFILLPTFLASKDPMLYVGNEILDDYSVYAQTEDKRAKLAECNELGEKFLSGRETMKLKDFEAHAHALNGMVVYWKTSGLQQAPEEAPA
jgi:hypothetical protein